MRMGIVFAAAFALWIATLPAIAANQNQSQHGLTVKTDGALYKNRKPYRGIGVNYFNAFYISGS